MAGPEIDEALLLDWTTAIEALDYDTIQELYELQPKLLWTALQPVHLESDFAHFIQRLESFKVLGTSLRPVYPLHHILFDYGVPGDEWASERSVLVDFILKNTTKDELNSCFWGAEENTTMHLAYLLNQPNLTEQLLSKGALIDIPNKSGHLPIKEESQERSNDDQPKLLINKSKPATKEKAPVNTSDRFRRLRELAESPHNKGNKTTTGRQNSTRRYFRPGHLEEKKRRILNEEEEELEKQKLKRQKDIELLAQRSAVKNNPLFKKFEEQKQKVDHKPAGPSLSAIRDKQKILKAGDQFKRSSRVMNSLKNSSYVSSSIFRQAQPSDEKNLAVPSLAKLRLGSKESLVESKDDDNEDVSQVDRDSILDEDISDTASSKSKASTLSLKVDNESIKSSSSASLKSPTASLKSNSTSLFSPTDSSFTLKNSTSTSLSLKSPIDTSFDRKNFLETDRTATDEELESLNVGKIRDLNTLAKSTQEKKPIDIGPSKIKDIVNMHEQHINVKEEVEIHTLGKKFEVWKKDPSTQEEPEDDYVILRNKDTDTVSLEAQPTKDQSMTTEQAASATTIDEKLIEQESDHDMAGSSLISIQDDSYSTVDMDVKSLEDKSDKSSIVLQDVVTEPSLSDKPEASKKKLDAVDQTQFKKDLKVLEKRSENTITKIEMHERAIEAAVKHKPAMPKKMKSLKLGPEALSQKRAFFNQPLPEEKMPTRRNEGDIAREIHDGSSNSASVSESDSEDEYSQHRDISRPASSSSTSTASSYSKSLVTPVIVDDNFKNAQIVENDPPSRFRALQQPQTTGLFESENDSEHIEKTRSISATHVHPVQNILSSSNTLDTTDINDNSTSVTIPTNNNSAYNDNLTQTSAKQVHSSSLSINTSTPLSVSVAADSDEEENALTPTLANIYGSHNHVEQNAVYKTVQSSNSETEPNNLETEPSSLKTEPNNLEIESSDLGADYGDFIEKQKNGVDLESELGLSKSDDDLTKSFGAKPVPFAPTHHSITDDLTNEMNLKSETSHVPDSDQSQQSIPPQRISIMSTATTSSDQWFDPEDYWTDQQRQSALLSNSYSEAVQETVHASPQRSSDLSSIISDDYYYKGSSSTDHTGIDEDLDNDSYKHMDSDKLDLIESQVQEKSDIVNTSTADIPEEDEDYYSTQLHAETSRRSQNITTAGPILSQSEQSDPAKERAIERNSIVKGNQGKEEEGEEEEGEIVVFMDPSDQQPINAPPAPLMNHTRLGVFHEANISTASLVSQRGQYLAVRQEDGTSAQSLIQVPSRTVPIMDSKTEQEYVPHDPNNPRVEDISHYMNTLPTLNKNNHEVAGSSAFDTSANANDSEESMTKRAISMAAPAAGPTVIEDSRGIPNAHEMEFGYIPEGRLSSSKESKASFEVSQYGKLYIGVSGAHNMLLPLPKEITYVRCVISDGEFEYVSRYEILGPQILMDYECCIDVRPGTIITVSLLVRPDFHVKPKTGWSRFFTSIRKQKEHLSGYVHPEDGAIGQTRFAVDHMVSGCFKKTYEAYFDCFNSWYARTNRERARREQFGDDEDFLKIIGKINIEMLYLPVSSPHVRVPRSLRECDLTLKIRQWHDTCWQSGYLSTRCQGKKIWERHFYRLIGSQLMGREHATEDIWDHYNIADVIKLSAAADKVIVTLVEEDDSKVFGDKTIHDYAQKGFFRLQFPNYYLDCVSDSLEESEEWVKTLKSMIGRVPLKLPFMEE